MKTSTEMKGLPIVNISRGEEVGTVKSLVINPKKCSVDFLTVEHSDWEVSVRAIPFRKVVGIGEYAVTIEGDNAVIDLNEIPIANELVNKKIKIIDTKVMTRKGELLGNATEYFIDKETGLIVALKVDIQEKEAILPNDYVLTYGKDIIVVKEDALTELLDDIDQLFDQQKDNAAHSEGEATMTADSDDLTSFIETEEHIIKEKQLQLLVGKTVKKDIFEKGGNLFVQAGTVLTEELVKQAQQIGFGLVIQLSMNVEV